MCSLISAFVDYIYCIKWPCNICYLTLWTTCIKADNEGSDQTAQMRSLIWAFVVRIWNKKCFHMLKFKYTELTGLILLLEMSEILP